MSVVLQPRPAEVDFGALVSAGRELAFQSLSRKYRGSNGQFFTPYPIARFMAGMQSPGANIRILDAGAGVGALTLATVEFALRQGGVKAIDAVCFEKESAFQRILHENLEACQEACADRGVTFQFKVLSEDFILSASHQLAGECLFAGEPLGTFTHAILNPPYKKLRSDSEHRAALREAGIETSNLYTAFLWLSLLLLEPGGEMTAITPRSFCNGLYFRPFRQALRNRFRFDHIHSIEERRTAFSEDEVLQENIIFHGTKKGGAEDSVLLSTGNGAEISTSHRVLPREVQDDDRDAVIHLILNQTDAEVRSRIESLPCSLADLGIRVSTGPVVDFRAKDFLRQEPSSGTVPLLYPCHFNGQTVHWPKPGHKKPNAMLDAPAVESQFLPLGHYTLVKRFTAKEETRRVVAVVLSPEDLPEGTQRVGIENHINYFHSDHSPLSPKLARGLYCFLNSTVVDAYLRVFNGHTQVNATDLRKLRYPDSETLCELARACWNGVPITQELIDNQVEQIIR